MLHLCFALLVLLLADLSDLASAKRLAGQGWHFLVLQRDGQVFAVGHNYYGQLGLNTTTDANLPQRMLSVTKAIDISAGGAHSCVLDQGSQVKWAGHNPYHPLQDGTKTQVLALVVGLDSGIAEVQCGFEGSCARTTSGKAQCWGFFASSVKTSPVTITVSGGVQSMSLGAYHICFVAIGGKLYCMGENGAGQLGTGDTTFQTEPTSIVDLAAEDIVSVACSIFHTCAVNAGGAMFCWGAFGSGRLGNPSVTSNAFNPVQVLEITSGAATAWAGGSNSFALMQNGTVLAFGQDEYGVFGMGSTGDKTAPIVFGKGVSGVVEVCGGVLSACVLLQNDTVWCTGDNRFGQLGVGSTANSRTLVEMVGIPATNAPTLEPTLAPTDAPTLQPTKVPTASPMQTQSPLSTLAPSTSGVVALAANLGVFGAAALLFL